MRPEKMLLWAALAIALVQIGAIPAAAQRMRYDEAEFKYTRLPLEPLDKSITNYYIEFLYGGDVDTDEAERVTRKFKDFSCEPLKRGTFEQLKDKPNVLHIRVWIKRFYSEEPVIHEKELLGSKGGKEYHYTIGYSYPLNLEVFIRNGTESKSILKSADGERKYTYTTGTRNTPGLQTQTTGISIYDDMKDQGLNANKARVEEAVRSRYAFATLPERQKVWAPKTTKKVDYTDLDSAQNKALRALNTIKPDASGGREQYRALIQEPIDLWLKVLQESNLADKKARINAEVTSSIRHNLAYAYFWLGDITKAEEQATLAAQEYKDSSWPAELTKKYITDYRKRWEANQPKQ